MADVATKPLQLDEHLDFQWKSWFVQRASWILGALALLSVLAGAAGDGWLSRRTLSAGPLRVEYQAILRQGCQSEVVLEFTPGGPLDPSIGLSHTFLEHLGLYEILPAPAAQIPRESGMEIVFAARDATARIVCRIRPDKAGSVHTRVRYGANEVVLRQFVLP